MVRKGTAFGVEIGDGEKTKPDLSIASSQLHAYFALEGQSCKGLLGAWRQ